PGCTSTAASCQNGGKNPFVYFESNGTCWSGENAALLVGGGVTLTYPGTSQITASGACSYVLGSFGSITIDVPISGVSLAGGGGGGGQPRRATVRPAHPPASRLLRGDGLLRCHARVVPNELLGRLVGLVVRHLLGRGLHQIRARPLERAGDAVVQRELREPH